MKESSIFANNTVREEWRGRILFVIGSLGVGGAENHLVKVAIALKKRGWEPEVFVLSLGGPLTKNLVEGCVPIRGLKCPQWIKLILRNEKLQARFCLILAAIFLFRSIFVFRPHIIHFFLPAAYVIGGVVSLLISIPVKIMSRRSLRHYQVRHPIFARLERHLHRHMTYVCGNSKAVVRELVEEEISPERVRLIYNGVDVTIYEEPFDRVVARSQENLDAETIVFVMVANLIPYKGHTDFINALAGIRKKLTVPWTALIVGRDDGIGDELRALAESAGLHKNIRFLGSRDDVPRLLRISDIGVLCSHEEGFSNAIIEAMAAGLPLVVTDVGGNAEAVQHETTGYVVPAADPASLGSALLALASDADRAQMGVRGKQRAAGLFDFHQSVKGYESLYREAILKSSTQVAPGGSHS